MVSPKSGASALEALVALCKAHGYVYAVETAGATVYNFGSLGAELRRNLQAEWWQSMVTTQDNVFGIENAICQSSPQDAHRPSNEAVEEAMQTGYYHCPQSLQHGVLSHYHSSLQLLNNKLPFGLAEMGRCFPRTAAEEERFLYSAREMTAMSMLFFVPPKKSGVWFDLYQRQRMQWWRKFASSPSSFSVVDTSDADNTYPMVNIQFAFPWGVDTVERIALRDDSDLLDLERKTGMSCQGKDGRKTVVPHVVEMETYLEWACLAYLLDGLTEVKRTETVQKILRLHCRLAPYKVAVLPGRGTESQLREITDYIARDLRTAGIPCWYSADPQCSNEQQYTWYDEMGVPFSVAVNENTIKTGITLVRNRDTTIKEQVHISQLQLMLLRYMQAY
ncbi:DNA polymerase subunit gamma-2, mitochondrial-like isoform X1 [Branchiostoma lanceolatum]|uniref:DNA polymerase subunit gamma-2, mitochondrial-like isoform X1 n=2 Tax=Branchiostoma lanceolatum TaxID=7740 RepID=UPI003451219E